MSHLRPVLGLCGLALVLAGCVHTPRTPTPADPDALLPAGHDAPPVVLRLTPDEVRDRAANESALARALEKAGRERHDCAACLPSAAEAELRRTIRLYSADEVRNRTAALALEAYFRCAEARGLLGTLKKGNDLAESLVRQAEELRDKGLPTPPEMASLEKSRSEQQTRSLEAGLLRDKLNEQIRFLIGGGLPPGSTVLTVETFQLRDEQIDEAEAVRTGLRFRPDLNLLRAACTRLDARTLTTVRQVLSNINGLLSAPKNKCIPLADCISSLLPVLSRGELDRVKAQLAMIHRDRTREAEAEIRSAVREVGTRFKLAMLAREREGIAARVVREAEEKERRGFNVRGELAAARGELYKAEGAMLHELIEWELSRVRLKAAQGLLVREARGCQR